MGSPPPPFPCPQAEREAEAAAKSAQVAGMMGNPWLCEDTSTALLEGGRIRREHFKGFSKDQIRHFYHENDAIVAAKAAEKVSPEPDTMGSFVTRARKSAHA
jgi:hypothetical protein